MDDRRYPQDTSQVLYLLSVNLTLGDIVESAKRHFPDCEMDDLKVEGENIQIKCFGYDLYDSGDYLDYIVITR